MSEINGIAQADPWRAIETVPMDGREVILRKGERVGAACWCKWPSTHDMDGCIEVEGGEGWSVGFDGDEWTDPTHWQPLPLPGVLGTEGRIANLESVLRRMVDLCAFGDVDETTDALGWGDLIKEAKATLASFS